jgi:hypothetical protein
MLSGKLMLALRSGIVLLALISIGSCSKDDDEKYKDFVTFGDTKFDVAGFYLFYDGSVNVNPVGEEYYRNELVLADKEIYTSEVQIGDDTSYGEFHGTGNLMSLKFIGTSQEFETGTYIYSGDEADYTPLNIWDGTIALNYDFETGTGDQYIITGLTMTIEPDGEFFKGNFQGTALPALLDVDGNITGPDESAAAITIKGQLTVAGIRYKQIP